MIKFQGLSLLNLQKLYGYPFSAAKEMHELHQVPSGWLQKGVDEAGRQVVKEVNSLIHESPSKKGGKFLSGFIHLSPKCYLYNLNLS